MSMCVDVFLLGYMLYGTLHFLDLIDFFLSHAGEVFSYYLLKFLLSAFLFLFFLWDPYNLNVGWFNIVPKVSEAILIFFFILFPLSCFSAVIYTSLSSSSYIPSSASSNLLLVPSREFWISVIELFICFLILYFFCVLGNCVNCFLHFSHSIFKVLEYPC